MTNLQERQAYANAQGLLWPVALVMAAALLIRFHGLGAPSFWLDEAYSAWFSARDWTYLWTEVPQFETHPSFYYSLLKLWRVFGTDEFTLRIPSVLFNVATIPLVALSARLCSDRRTGRSAAILAAILFAGSATQVYAAQEARPYALMTLAMAVALTSALAVMTARARAGAPMHRLLARDRKMALAFAGIGIGIALLAWSHNFGPVFGLILGACLFAWWLSEGAPRGLLVNLLLSAGLAALLYAPNIPILLMQTRSLGAEGFWLEPPGPRAVASAILELPLGHSRSEGAVILLFAALSSLVALSGLAGMMSQKERPPLAVPVTLVVLATVPAILSFAGSHMGQPIFLFRTFQASQLPVLISLAFAPLALRPLLPARWRWTAPAVPLLLAATALWSAPPGKPRWSDENWRDFTRRMAEAPVPAKLVVYPAEAEMPLLYYGDRLGLPLDIAAVPGHYPVRGAEYSYPAGGGGSPGMTPGILSGTMANLAGDARVWIVTRGLDTYDPAGLFMTRMQREFPCLLDDTMPRIELRSRVSPDGSCPGS
ncbi:hypothetical protein GIY56_15870 [Paracoccus sp. YIM 132242]|uniref:Glycosyltransferase RgtA/B/C/D-like domain-containing protein n=1 Tax=Paracoccus lichenicola TaxID=2665644 RepID=A0A6L6HWS0_9RHOB|nr:hypothetical protein [Paracoccus lichenicola]MTE01768.1 hypothetical protein [Paracoccus lichenicola]